MARTICIANQKGGVGKTTTSVNLSAALSRRSRRVLLLDMDPQGNASSGIGLKRYQNQNSNIYHVLIGEQNLDEATRETSEENLFVVPANSDLVGAEIELVDMPEREYRLKAAIAAVSHKYDFVIIDCPPSLGLLTVNALSAADSFLVPLQCEYFALEGLSQLLNTAGIIKKNLNKSLKIEGIVLTMFDKRNNLSHQVVTEIQTHFGDKVFHAIIPRNVRLSEAPSHGKSIFSYDNKSVGAKRYGELAKELDEKTFGFGTHVQESTKQSEEAHFSDNESEGESVSGRSVAAMEESEPVAPESGSQSQGNENYLEPEGDVTSGFIGEKNNQGSEKENCEPSSIDESSKVLPIYQTGKPHLRAVEDLEVPPQEDANLLTEAPSENKKFAIHLDEDMEARSKVEGLQGEAIVDAGEQDLIVEESEDMGEEERSSLCSAITLQEEDLIKSNHQEKGKNGNESGAWSREDGHA